jgi:colanic acid/amylovoran biosynthesis glycosyltransferase
MATIAIVTSSFPFSGGEQFLESEIEYWGSSLDRIIVLPVAARGVARTVPAAVEVELTLAEMNTTFTKFVYFIASPFSRVFVNEARYLRSVGKLNCGMLYQSARETARTLMCARGLRKVARRFGGRIDLVYSYWNDATAFGGAVSKRRGYVKRVVSRAHGEYDIYEETRDGDYMPLKRQFIGDFDALFPVSQDGRDYMAKTYGVVPERNIVSRLGVQVPERMTLAGGNAQCRIVSVSFCMGVKRIDKIIQALAAAARSMPEISFRWTHVGGGPLLPELQKFGDETLSGLSNVDHVFTGTMVHQDVLKFLIAEPIDMLINTSESEGIPVSIMEAMSCGIPAIAPEVGGVPELVANGRGVLMSATPEVDDVARCLTDFMLASKRPETRQRVREFVKVEFNEARNYPAFVEQCTQIARL